MMITIKDTPDDFGLRRQAEEKLKEATSDNEDLSGVSPERMASLIHELEVHQIELKMQNDELRRIQSELEKTRDKYSHLYDFAPVGYFTVSEKGIIKEVNLTGASLIGIERNALIGKPFTRFVLGDDQDIFYQHRRRLLETETSQSCELRLMRDDGHDFYARLECMIIKNKDDDLRQIRAAVSDITNSKRMEAELLRTQKLESVGMLAGGIAHDFNNILTVILGNVSMAKMQVRPGDDVFDLLTEAETASARAQILARQLLTFAKGGTPVKEVTSIKDIIKKSSILVLRGLKSRCEYSIAEDLWPAEIDFGQISQVINNIVINAERAMPAGGIIQIAAENLIIDDGHGLPLKPGRYIRISIKDQGAGITEKHLVKIFDPYFKTNHGGSNLELAASHSIVKKHDGHITLESQVGVGTTFHIYLPASGKIVPVEKEDRLITGYGRILVMDDEGSLRKIVGRMLDKLGYESEFAKDGAEAIGMYKAAMESGMPYDAVILDLTIPGGMGGKEAINKLLEIDPGIKAIVSSGYSDDPILANFQKYGFKGMMPKPFESQSLSKALHEVLQVKKHNNNRNQ
jgi:two-component system, cell cycle sensor histidine kinase and response regulator CckA